MCKRFCQRGAPVKIIQSAHACAAQGMCICARAAHAEISHCLPKIINAGDACATKDDGMARTLALQVSGTSPVSPCQAVQSVLLPSLSLPMYVPPCPPPSAKPMPP